MNSNNSRRENTNEIKQNKLGIVLNNIINLIYDKIKWIDLEGDYIKSINGLND